METDPSAAPAKRAPRWFFMAVAGLLLGIVLVGFAPSFFLKAIFHNPGQIVLTAESIAGKDLGDPSTPPHVILHGTSAALWMLLLLLQAGLVAADRRDVHKRLGIAGLVLGVVVAGSGFAALLLAMPRLVALSGADPSLVLAEHMPGVAGDFGSFFAFSAALGFAAYYHGVPERHKQLMVLAAMTLISPPLARIWMNSGVDGAMEIWFPLSENGLAVLIIGGYWLVRRRAPRVLLVGFVLWLAVYSTLFGVGSTEDAQIWVAQRLG